MKVCCYNIIKKIDCRSEMQKKSKEAHMIQMEEEAALRRSTRVRAAPRDNPARAFLKYVNKLKED